MMGSAEFTGTMDTHGKTTQKKRLTKTANLLNEMAGATRLELATSGVTGRRSNQLNYAPSIRF
jgi:hypothetical protein